MRTPGCDKGAGRRSNLRFLLAFFLVNLLAVYPMLSGVTACCIELSLYGTLSHSLMRLSTLSLS